MRIAKGFVAAWALFFCVELAQAQPRAPVRMLVGYPPGGLPDIVARLYSEKLAEGIGRPVVVETRSGATGQIAMMALKNSAPDGNTLLLEPTATIVLYPHTVKKPLFDVLKDFVPVAHAGSYDVALAVGAGVPANDLKEWLSWAKADPRHATYGSVGVGTTMHFVGTMLAQASGVPLVHVPYRGITQAMTDLEGGRLPAFMISLPTMVAYAKSGKVRILAQSGGQRSTTAPQIPTFKELGYPALEVPSQWYGIFAPAGTRPDLVSRYNNIIVQAQRTPAVRERMRAIYFEIREVAPGELAAMFKSQYDSWGAVVKASGYTALESQ